MLIEDFEGQDDTIKQSIVGGKVMTHGEILGMLTFNPSETTAPKIEPEKPNPPMRESKDV